MRHQDTFDPEDPFGDAAANPAGSAIAQEIDMLAADFAVLGVSAHSAVPLWMGKPNRFTGAVMHSAKEVLDYIAAELAQQAQARAAAQSKGQQATAHAPQADAGPAAGVVSATAAPPAPSPEIAERRRLHKVRVGAANEAWRAAIKARAEAMLQWDAYVNTLRVAYQAAKLEKV